MSDSKEFVMRQANYSVLNNSEKVRWLHYLLVYLFIFLSPTCRLWRRDNNEVDGGDDDQRDQRTTSPKKVRWLYDLSVVVVLCGCYLFVVSHMLAMAEGQQQGGWWR